MDSLKIILIAVDAKTPSAFPLPWYGRMFKAASVEAISQAATTHPPALLIVIPLVLLVQIVVLPLKIVVGKGNLLEAKEREGRRVLESELLKFHEHFVTPYSDNPSDPKPRLFLSLRTTGVRRATPWRGYQKAYEELCGKFDAYCKTIEVLCEHPSSSLADDNSGAAPAQSPALLVSGFYGFKENYKGRLNRVDPSVLFPEHFQLEPLSAIIKPISKLIFVTLVVMMIFGAVMVWRAQPPENIEQTLTPGELAEELSLSLDEARALLLTKSHLRDQNQKSEHSDETPKKTPCGRNLKPKYIKYEDNLKPEEMEAPVFMVKASQATVTQSQGKTQWPVEQPKILRAYGKQKSFFIKDRIITNSGIDIGAAKGTPIRSIASGTVAFTGCDHWGMGNVVTVKHDAGFYSNYKHMFGYKVSEGARVSAGEVIGWVGDTGQAATIGTMVRIETSYFDPATKVTKYFDPREVLPALKK